MVIKAEQQKVDFTKIDRGALKLPCKILNLDIAKWNKYLDSKLAKN